MGEGRHGTPRSWQEDLQADLAADDELPAHPVVLGVPGHPGVATTRLGRNTRGRGGAPAALVTAANVAVVMR